MKRLQITISDEKYKQIKADAVLAGMNIGDFVYSLLYPEDTKMSKNSKSLKSTQNTQKLKNCDNETFEQSTQNTQSTHEDDF